MSGRGLLVAVEGIDGSGKTSFVEALSHELRKRGVSVRSTREPTTTTLGEAVRSALQDPTVSPFSLALLFLGDHATHVERVRRWVEEGEIVLSDRWSDSTLAYQSAELAPLLSSRGIHDPIRYLSGILAAFDVPPDLVLLLDLPVPKALERVQRARTNLQRYEREEILEKVRSNYLRLSSQRPWYRTLDATLPLSQLVGEALPWILEIPRE